MIGNQHNQHINIHNPSIITDNFYSGKRILFKVIKPFKAYKGTRWDMSCRAMKYELDFPYSMEVDKDFGLCMQGYHCCLELKDINPYYRISNPFHRFFEVEIPEGAIISADDHKLVTNKIKFVRELESNDYKSVNMEKSHTVCDSYVIVQNRVDMDDKLKYTTTTVIEDGMPRVHHYDYKLSGYIHTFYHDKVDDYIFMKRIHEGIIRLSVHNYSTLNSIIASIDSPPLWNCVCSVYLHEDECFGDVDYQGKRYIRNYSHPTDEVLSERLMSHEFEYERNYIL